DLSQRIVSGVRHLEIEALAGAGEDTGDNGDMHNSEARESLQRAVRLQMEMEQLKTRMDSLKGGDDLLLAGHLLDCREALRRLADQAAAENQKAENNQGDGNLLWKQLASDLEEVQKDLDAKLSSKVPRGWRGMTRSQTGTSEASRWLSRLKEAASRAALFARAVRSRKDKEQLQKLQEQLLSELQSSEAEAAEGGARGDKWKQLHSLWSRLKGELEQAKQLPSGTSQDAASRLTSFVAARRSKLTSQKRSQTQPLGSLAEDVDKAAAEKIREDLEKLRRKVKQLPGKAGSEQQLLMAGFLQLHGEELAALKDAIKDRADKAVDMDDMADLSWQQLRADLEDLEAQLSGASTSAGRLTAGIGSRLLSPKKGGKLAPLKKTEPDVSKDLAQAAGSFLQASEALAKIRQRQLEETNPMLRLGQAVSDEQALAELEKDVATALANCRGQGDEKATLQLLWQKLQEELAEARATAAKDQDIGDTSSGFSAHLLASQSDEEIFSDELEADYGAERQSAWGWGDQGQGQGAQRKASGREHLLSALKLLQQDLQDEDSPQVERLAALCRSLGLLDPEKSLKDGLRSRQAWGASALNAAGTEKDSRSSSDRDALQSVLNMLQRNVEVGGDNSESMQMLAAICSKLGLSTERGVDDSPLPEEVQRRAARLEEQLELQRQNLQRHKEAAAVLAGHSLLHQSLIEGAAQERDACARDCELALQDASPKECERLAAQSEDLQQLWQSCAAGAQRLRQELAEAAATDPSTRALLNALDTAPNLGAALRALARLDDQLEQQRAALRARGRRRPGDLDEATLIGLIEKKNKALRQLAEAANGRLEDEAWRAVYDAWRGQISGGLEQLLAVDISGAGSPTHGNEVSANSSAALEARGRLAGLEEECERRRLQAKRGNGWMGSNVQLDADQELSESLLDSEGAKGNELKLLEEQLRRVQSSLGREGGQDSTMAAGLLVHDSALDSIAQQLDKYRRRLAQDPGNKELEAQCDALSELLQGCRGLADAKMREILEGGDPAAAAVLALRRTGKMAFTDDDRQALLEEALRRLARFDDQLERRKATLARRRKRGQSADLDDDDLRQLLADKANALQQLEELLEASGGDPALRQLRDLCRDRLAADLSQLVVSSDGLAGREGCDPSELLAEARRRLAVLEEETAGQRFARRRRASEDPSTVAGMASHIQRLEEQLQELRSRMQRLRGDIGQPDKDSAMLAAHVLEHERSLEDMAHEWQRCQRQLQCTEEDELQAQSDLVGDLLRGCRSSNAALAREIAEASLDDPAIAAILSKRTDKKAFADDDRQALLEEALRRLARFDDQLERQRGALARRRKMGQSADLDDDDLRQLLADKATALETLEELLATSGGDPALWRLRDLCRDRAADLEQLVASSDGRAGREGCDPSALLAEARRRLAVLEEETAGQRFARRQRGRAAEKDPSTDAGMASHIQRLEEQLQELRGRMQHVRGDIGQPDKDSAMLAAHVLAHESSLEEMARQWQRCQFHCTEAQSDLVGDLLRGCRSSNAALAREIAEASLDDPAVAAILSKRTDKKAFADDDRQALLEEALRRLARFDDQLERQRGALARRRKMGKSADLDDDDLRQLLADKATALETLEELLETSGGDPALRRLRDLCRDRAADLEQLVASSDGPGREGCDPSALLAEARRRLAVLEEETAGQRFARRRPGRAAEKASSRAGQHGPPKMPLTDDAKARQAALADAARRLACFEEQLDTQRQGLLKRRRAPAAEADGVLAAHALLHTSSIDALASERDACYQHCQKLLQEASVESWTEDEKVACQRLAAQCESLSDTWSSCAQSAELLSKDVSKAAPSALTSILRSDADDTQAALAEALRRVARFDHELEQQRSLLQRRPAPNKAMNDAILSSLVEEKKTALAQCEENASDVAWKEVRELWQGPLTSGLEKLTVSLSEAKSSPSRLLEKPDTSAALAEARRRLVTLEEETDRQRVGLRKRGRAEEAQRRKLQQLAANAAEFQEIATEHCQGLKEQQNNLSEAMEKDLDPMEEIEAWRQQVGLEELQAAASRMSEQLATIEEEEDLEASELPADVSSPKRWLSNTNTDTAAAKQQCQVMQARLLEMREDEERERLLLRRRQQQRPVKESPAQAESAARETEESSRDLLLKLLRDAARAEHRDVFFFDNGDINDGTGLSASAEDHVAFLAPVMRRWVLNGQAGYDALNLGNHELYQRNGHGLLPGPECPIVGLQESGYIASWRGRYLTANVVWSNSSQPVGDRYAVLQGDFGTKLLAFGFLYNMDDHCDAVKVLDVESVVKSDWFLSALDQQCDAVVVLAHMDYRDTLVDVIFQAIRRRMGAKKPIQILAGHSHIRGYRQLDDFASVYEAGCKLDTVGFLSFERISDGSALRFHHANITGSRLDLAGALNRTPQQLRPSAGVHQALELARRRANSDDVLGCASDHYHLASPLQESGSLWSFYMNTVLPGTLINASEQIAVVGTGALTYDIYAGEFLVDDAYTASPYGNFWLILEQLPGADLAELLSQLNRKPPTGRPRRARVPDYVSSGEPQKGNFYESRLSEAWRHQLEKLRKEAVIEEEKQEPEEPEEPRERETPEPKPPKEELAAALAASDERLDFVSRMGKDLFSQLEVIFQSHPADVGTAVAGAVERWRQLLPQELHSAEDGAQTVEHLERMGGAAERAAQVVQEVDFSSQRQAFMKSWKDGLTSSTQDQAESEGFSQIWKEFNKT
ncbi:unnamed protein product, partial [Effrenium voratum]